MSLYQCPAGRKKEIPSDTPEINLLLNDISEEWALDCLNCNKKEAALVLEDDTAAARLYCVWKVVS